MRRPAAAFLAALLLPFAAAPAFAGASITKPFGEARRDSLGPDGMPVPGVALRLSLNGTALPVGTGAALFAVGAAAQSPHVILIGAAFTAAGLVLGPAAGYRYGDVPGHGVSGIALRAALIAGPPLLATASAPTGLEDGVRSRRIGYAAIGGGALAIALGVWDIEHVEDAVRRRNAGRRRPASGPRPRHRAVLARARPRPARRPGLRRRLSPSGPAPARNAKRGRLRPFRRRSILPPPLSAAPHLFHSRPGRRRGPHAPARPRTPGDSP